MYFRALDYHANSSSLLKIQVQGSGIPNELKTFLTDPLLSPVLAWKQEPASLGTAEELQSQSTALKQQIIVKSSPEDVAESVTPPLATPTFHYLEKWLSCLSKYQGFCLRRVNISAASVFHVLISHIPKNNKNNRQFRQVSSRLVFSF